MLERLKKERAKLTGQAQGQVEQITGNGTRSIDPYVSNPQPAPMPEPPPVPEDHEDMQTYQEMLEENSNVYSEPKEPETGPSPAPGLTPAPTPVDLSVTDFGGEDNSGFVYDDYDNSLKVTDFDEKDAFTGQPKGEGYYGFSAEELNYKRQEETRDFIEQNNEIRESDKALLKEDIINRNLEMYNKAVIAAQYGNYKSMQDIITVVYNGEPMIGVPPERLKEDLIVYALKAENYEQLCNDLDVHYDKLEAEGVQNINDEFEPYFERRYKLDRYSGIDGNQVDAQWVKSPLAPELKASIIQETLVNMGDDLPDYYYEAIQNGQCEMYISEYNEAYYTKAEATALYFKEQEERDQLVGLIVAAVESYATQNPAPVIWEIADIAVSSINEDEANEYILKACEFYVEGADYKEFAKGEAIDYTIEEILHAIDAMRDDVTKIEAGTYARVEVQLQPFNDYNQTPNEISGLPENYINVVNALASLRLIDSGNGLVCNWENPICYVLSDTIS